MSLLRSREPPAALRALSADARWLSALRQRDLCGRVHSVFDHIVNVQDDRGEMFSLATRNVDDAPNTLIVDVHAFIAIRVHPDDRVTGSACRLDVANHAVIALDHVIAWHPRRLSYPRDASRLEQNLALARRHATAAFGHPLECTAWSASARLQRLSTQLCEALSNRDREAARLHGRALLGLGPGLTPSGDDFLLGLFAVLHIDGSPCARLRGLCTDIVEDLEHRTNAISAAALTAAAQGRVRETIDTLLSALMTGDEATVRRALDRVLRIGSTSGRDIVSGIVAGFDANLQATESRSVRVDG